MEPGALSKTLHSPEFRQLLPSLGMDAVELAEWMKSLPIELVEKLRSASTPRDYPAGNVLFHKGDVADGIYFIESGEVRASTLTQDGRECLLYLFEPGSCVGVASALDGKPSPSTCSAFCDTRVRLLLRSDLLAILNREPQHYRHFVDLLLRWVRGLIGVIEDQAVLSLRARLAKRLLQLSRIYGQAAPDGIVLPLKLSQDELGLLLGATRQSIFQQLKDFRARGWITIEKGTITLRDPHAMAACIDECDDESKDI